MTDTKYNQMRITASKAIRNKILSEKHNCKVSSVRIFILENYGIGGRWVDQYLIDLEDEGYIKLSYEQNKPFMILPIEPLPRLDKSVFQ